ncbi:MAG: hypothetical protein Q4F49_07545 [Pseudoxanthomonas suwonensis]|nr:hypothetical protein [Pseudoxanthomonas suwonensis]
MRMRFVEGLGLGLLLLASGHLQAQGPNCASVPLVMPLDASLLAPVSADLFSPTQQMAVSGGVLARAYDEAQSVERVLLRMQVDACRNVSRVPAMPGGLDPNDPATYKPRTEFDNAPWRFDMTQNGRRMTADEFSAWMESRGIRISKGVPRTAETVRAEQEAAQQQPPQQ